MQITGFGTTTLLLDDGTDQILFDCHFTRPSLWKCGLGRLNSDPVVVDHILAKHSIDRLKAVFVSHSHHDHVLDAPYIVQQTGAELYGSASTLNIARGNGVRETKLHAFDTHTVYRIGAFRIQVYPSLHSRVNRFNDNLGENIDTPLAYPARMSSFKEGGSFDFLIEHSGKKFLIRPSCNYLEDQWNGVKADVLFQGVTGLSKETEEQQRRFFAETVDKVCPETVIPIHWDHFFLPLSEETRPLPYLFGDGKGSKQVMERYCMQKGINVYSLRNGERIIL